MGAIAATLRMLKILGTLTMQKHKGVAILIFSFHMQVLQSPAQPTSYRVMNNQMHKKITLEGYVNASAALKK